jgi:pimeloyl-ACP methyl ester carboxylesterase
MPAIWNGLLGAILMAPLSVAAAPEWLVGRWEGIATHNDSSWQIALNAWKESGRLMASLEFPDAGQYALKIDEFQVGPDGSIRLLHSQRRPAITMEAQESRGRLIGTLEGFDVNARVAMTRESAVPHRLIEVPIRIRSDGVALAGTLVKPPTPGPHPVIIWTHGSGFIGRHSEPYRMLGYLFARHGMASLLYDKRGVKDSTGDFRQATIEELAEDALAAVPILKERNDIDATRIGIGGHSQGGWIAPLAASRSDHQIAFLVVIAAAGMSPFEQGSYVVENKLRHAGHVNAVVEQALMLRQRLLRFLRTGENADGMERQLMNARREPWYRDALLPFGSLDDFQREALDWLTLDPQPLWERISVPVLAVWAEKDRIVPSRRSYELIQAALRRGQNNQATLVILPDADHNLSLVRADDQEWDWPRIAPDLETHIADWTAKFLENTE